MICVFVYIYFHIYHCIFFIWACLDAYVTQKSNRKTPELAIGKFRKKVLCSNEITEKLFISSN